MSRPLRIANIVQLAPRKLGSMEDSLVAMVEEASRRGHRMDVMTAAPVHPVIMKRMESAGSRWQNFESLLANPVASARLLSKNYDVLVLNLFAPRSKMALIADCAFPARIVFVDNFSAMPSESASGNVLRRLVDRATMLRISALVAVSDYVLRRDMARFGISAPFARRIYNAVDPQRFLPPPGGRSGAPTALVVASLIPEKGIHVLIDAFSRVDIPDARLQVVGEGPERARLEELARSLGVANRVAFLGLRDDVDELLLRAHVFVHPCIWEEAFGYTLAEALFTECPVIASRIGATPEIVTDGENGLLVPAGDSKALTAAITSVLRDEVFRRRLGTRARQIAVERFALADSTTAHLDCYEQAGS
jgi:glycosyltransferase involved in cell wall biosynthesis